MRHERPERIDQIIPSIIEHDAVSNHTFAVQNELRSLGFRSDIYAAVIGPGCEGRVIELRTIPRLARGQWVLYQCSIGAAAAEVFAAHPGRKLLDYHNIVPAPLVERFIPPLGAEARLGRAQLAALAPAVDFAFADSLYNASELVAAGYRFARVVPVLVEAGNLSAPPDEGTAARLSLAAAGGGSDWLFVGQVAPHKAQHDLVAAFACFRELYDDKARLHLVGREMGSTYRRALCGLIDSLGLRDAVELTGAVSTRELAAYYDRADVFVGLSLHEGYCAPVIEAMARGLPVVAFRAGAIAETVGDGGLVLDRRDPAFVASVVHEVVSHDALRAELVEAGRVAAGRHSLEAARNRLRETVREALEVLG